jgi:predicted phage terminase large subunit-like protein
MDFPKTLEAVRALTVKWPSASAKLVEDKANGTAVIATLKHEITGLIEVNPEGGKQARAAAVSPQIEAGNVYLPHPSLYPWVPDYIAEWGMFPKGANDDMVGRDQPGLASMVNARGAQYPPNRQGRIGRPILRQEHRNNVWSTSVPEGRGMELIGCALIVGCCLKVRFSVTLDRAESGLLFLLRFLQLTSEGARYRFAGAGTLPYLGLDCNGLNRGAGQFPG